MPHAVIPVAALAGLFLGCAEGVFVEVHTDRIEQPVDRVELLITSKPCFQDGDACPYIQGPGFPTPLGEPGDVYLRDLGTSTNQLTDGVAVFELPAGDRLLPLGVAIARDVQGQIIGAAVMEGQIDLANSPVIYRVVLDPVEPLLGRQDPMRAGVAEWNTGLDECIGIQPVRPDRGRPVFLVPKDNPDCDAATPTNGATECDPFWYDGFSGDAAGEHCVMPSEVIGGAPCVLGHLPTCVENEASPNAPSCLELARDPSAEPICLPFALCDACEQSDVPCQEQLLSALSTPRVDCLVPGTADGGMGTTSNCSNNVFELLPNSFTEGTRCVDANFIATPDIGFDSGLGRAFSDGVSKFEITALDETSCVIKMQWDGTMATNTIAHTILEVTVESAFATRKLWVPIKFAATEVCPLNTLTCNYIDTNMPADPILRCAQ